jgi:mRNA interferase ChpB
MERGDIYLVSLDPTSGYEQQGTRPVLVVSPVAFNQLTKTPVVLPITSGGNFARTAGFAVSLMGAGTNTTGVVASLIWPHGTPASWKAYQLQSWTKCWRS